MTNTRFPEAVAIRWGTEKHYIEYARLAELIKAGRDALANLADNIMADPIADQEDTDLMATVTAGDGLLEYLCPPSSPDNDIPF